MHCRVKCCSVNGKKIENKMAKEAELDVGMKCIKYMLFVANFMFVLVGFLLISIGSTIKAVYGDFDVFMSDHYFSASKLAIAIGIIIFFVAFFGCIGAIKESVVLVNIYAFLLFCVLILEIAVSITAYAMRKNLENTVRINMETSIYEYDNAFTAYTWNATQYNLRCCGVDGPSDWDVLNGTFNLDQIVSTITNVTYNVPETCCMHETCENDEDRLYKTGCLSRIAYLVSECALLLAVGAVCVSFIQLLGVIFAHLLAKSIRRLKTQILVERNERRQHIYEQLANAGNNEKVVTPVLYTPTSSEA